MTALTKTDPIQTEPKPAPQATGLLKSAAAKPTTPENAWSVRRPVAVGLVTLFLLVVCLGGWSVMTTLSGAIVANGRIEVEQNRQVVQHLDGGSVASIHVTEGQPVKAGDLLVRLDGSALKSELAIVEGQFFELLARRGRLEAERDDKGEITFAPELITIAAQRADVAELMEGQRRLFDARKDTLAQQVDQLAKRKGQIASQITGIDAQSNALTQQLNLIGQELAAQQELLNKGLAQASRVLALQREDARLAGQRGELTANRAQSEGRMTESDIEVLKLAATRREEASTQLRDIGYRELELAERRRALIEKIQRLDIVAPVSGIVLGLQVTTPQAVLRPADPLMYIIPQDRPLVINVQVPPIHIDQVHVGQEVRLVFSSFSSRTTPELKGHVTLVSPDALTDQRTQQPYYSAEIVPDEGEIAKLSELGLKIIPGMPVEAFIRTGDRTPLAYLLKPFTDYFARAFRET
ncbi:HlyD family type I secretion periplasmic adaptor subunit [Pseudorhodobacter sp.]|uniref:HlyD family type I secretion periplasmic adaptor subunit n=1 Tax=Pseudorhodobacter sp. TaxID=1934400 RepID=UPI002649E2AC|nr:HlyD family type I secretion periplasmic adaptor subunit [Pseudorhodobacter sp.]MDN5786552.1 HlyD family type I secretion periplasmic adaptor subunit [Pseudorhodobacter sp.]